MKKLYAKNETAFAIILIVLYVVLFSVADSISDSLGITKIFTAPIAFVYTVILLVLIKKNDLMKKYGLCRPEGKAKEYFYFLPLMLTVAVTLIGGIHLNNSVAEIVLHIITMIFVGIIEEIIFRGFLFKAMCKDGFKLAVIISSLSFGFGHIINLLNGAPVIQTLLQIGYATAAGFMFTAVFYKSKSILPCIVTHSVLNSLSIFTAESSLLTEVIICAVLIVIPTMYGIILLKKQPIKNDISS